MKTRRVQHQNSHLLIEDEDYDDDDGGGGGGDGEDEVGFHNLKLLGMKLPKIYNSIVIIKSI